MLIINCIENMNNVFDNCFKNKSLQDFSTLQGNTVHISKTESKQLYAFQTNGKFYLSFMEELLDDEVQFKVFEFNNLWSMIDEVDNLISWDKNAKEVELLQTFNIIH